MALLAPATVAAAVGWAKAREKISRSRAFAHAVELETGRVGKIAQGLRADRDDTAGDFAHPTKKAPAVCRGQ
jgi:hypothetical protein